MLSDDELRKRPSLRRRRDEIERWPRPPRPLSLRVNTKFLLGSHPQPWLWFAFLFGMVMTWLFCGLAEIPWELRGGEIATTRGVVVEPYPNDGREKVRYRYRVGSGKLPPLEGISYGASLPAGEEVTVEFLREQPTVSRIRNLSDALIPASMWILALWPLIGVVALVVGVRGAFRDRRLLRDGIFVQGRVTAVEDLNQRLLEEIQAEEEDGEELTDEDRITELDPLHHVRFSLSGYGGAGRDLDYLAKPGETFEVGDVEPFLYDPKGSAPPVPLDLAPLAPRLDSDGTLTVSGADRALPFLWNPIAGVVMLAGFIWLVLWRIS